MRRLRQDSGLSGNFVVGTRHILACATGVSGIQVPELERLGSSDSQGLGTFFGSIFHVSYIFLKTKAESRSLGSHQTWAATRSKFYRIWLLLAI